MELSLLLITIALLGMAVTPAAAIPDAIINPIQAQLEESLKNILLNFNGEQWTIDIGNIPSDLDLVVTLDSAERYNMDINITGNEQYIGVLMTDENDDQVSNINAVVSGTTDASVRAEMGGNVDMIATADIKGLESVNAVIRGPNNQGISGKMVVDLTTNAGTDLKLFGETKSVVANLEVISDVALEVFSLKAGTKLLSGHSWSLLILIAVSTASFFMFVVYIWAMFVMQDYSDMLSSTQQPSHAKEAPDLATVTCMACPDTVVNNWGSNFCRGCGSNILYTGMNRESHFQPLSSIPGPPSTYAPSTIGEGVEDPSQSLSSQNPFFKKFNK